MLQREANTLAGQSQPPPPPPKWPGMISSEQLSLELHQVEREIGKRTRELSMVSVTMEREREGERKPVCNCVTELVTLEF